MTVTLEQAQAELPQLLASMTPGEELMIVRGDVRIAKLTVEGHAVPKPRIAGRGKGEILFMAEDFNATPEEFHIDSDQVTVTVRQASGAASAQWHLL